MNTPADIFASPLARLTHAYADRFAAARAWQRAGGRVVGYVSTAVPRELIDAAGAFPLMICGDPRRATPHADRWMEEQFDPMARSVFELALAGELAFLDLMIVPRVADSWLRLYLYLREIERTGESRSLPPVLLFDLLQTRHHSSEHYNQARVRELASALGSRTGRTITDAALREAIARRNDNERELAKLRALRQRDPPGVAGSLALQLAGAEHFIPPRDYASLLRAALAVLPARPRAQGPRLVVAGNAQDTSVLYELLESQGFNVVGDYHWLGDAQRVAPAETSAPWLALADHYHHHA